MPAHRPSSGSAMIHIGVGPIHILKMVPYFRTQSSIAKHSPSLLISAMFPRMGTGSGPEKTGKSHYECLWSTRPASVEQLLTAKPWRFTPGLAQVLLIAKAISDLAVCVNDSVHPGWKQGLVAVGLAQHPVSRCEAHRPTKDE